MRRRDFLKAASGVTVAAGAAGAAAAESAPSGSTALPAQEANETTTGGGNETTGNGTTTSGGLPGAGTTKTVAVGPGGENVFDPETVYVRPGATVEWTWESDNHNIVVEAQPEAADWQGTQGPETKTYNTGHTYSHQFTTTGTYDYYCNPHRQVGMVGQVVVNESGQPPGGGGGEAEANPEEMGVPFQAHFVGIATIVMVIVSLVYSFFTLKYGGSRHASSGD